MSSLATLPKQLEEEYQWDLAELNQFPKDGLGMLLLKRGMLITEAGQRKKEKKYTVREKTEEEFEKMKGIQKEKLPRQEFMAWGGGSEGQGGKLK